MPAVVLGAAGLLVRLDLGDRLVHVVGVDLGLVVLLGDGLGLNLGDELGLDVGDGPRADTRPRALATGCSSRWNGSGCDAGASASWSAIEPRN